MRIVAALDGAVLAIPARLKLKQIFLKSNSVFSDEPDFALKDVNCLVVSLRVFLRFDCIGHIVYLYSQLRLIDLKLIQVVTYLLQTCPLAGTVFRIGGSF